MESNTFTTDMTGSFESEELDYDVDEERWFSLPTEAKVALAIAGLDMEEEGFEEAGNITKALISATELDDHTIREANRWLVGKGYLDRSGFMTGDALKLSLNDEGYKFLEDELARVS